MKNTPNHTRDITFIDTHCHLDDERYIHDLDFVIDNARSLGVAQIIIPAANPDTLERAKNIANKYENIYFYFDGDIIRKKISLSKNSYYETELNEKTTENRTVILPKTARGKIKIMV